MHFYRKNRGKNMI